MRETALETPEDIALRDIVSPFCDALRDSNPAERGRLDADVAQLDPITALSDFTNERHFAAPGKCRLQ